MKFRVARHTNQLKEISLFYKSILGFTELGSFTNHDGYDGIFLGIPNENWHLEFTTSDEAAMHNPDEDDFLVFYVTNIAEQEQIKEKCRASGVELRVAKNPYWNKNGLIFNDPDGFHIIVAIA